MTSAAVDAARLIAQHWRDGTKLDALPAQFRPADLAAGHRAQAALPEVLHDDVVGWKLAATAEPGQRHLGVDAPIPGRLFSRRVLAGGAEVAPEVAPKVAMEGNRMRVAECEFVFELGADLPPREAPYTRDEVMAAVCALRPGLELPDSRFSDFASVGAPSLAADNACAHWMVLGTPATVDWRALDLAAHETRLRIDGREVTRGRGADVLGDPRDALTSLANAHALTGEGLRAGQVITTGVTGMPSPILPGNRIEADLGVLGSVRATIAR